MARKEELPTNEAGRQSLFDFVPDAVLVSDKEGRIVRVNSQAEAMFGYSREELLGQSIDLLVPERLRESHVGHRAHYYSEPRMRPMGIWSNLSARHKDGSEIPVDISLSAFTQDEDLFVISVVRDISERKRLESTLQESQRTLSTLMSNLRGMVYRCKYDRDRTLEFASDGCSDLTGYAAADFVQNKKVSFGDLIHPEDRGKVWDDIQSAVREKRPFQRTFRITTATGNEKWVWEQGLGIFSPDGTVEALEGFICDITARKRDADALGAYAQRLRSLSRRLLHVQETERHHIARELHDQVGQLLTGLKLNLEMLQHGNADFAGALNLINELTTRVRSLSLDLRPSMLDDLGLLPALLWHFDNYAKQTHVRVRFHHDGLDRRMAPDIETAAYRIVQEALTNVARHAGVDETAVRCSASQTRLDIQVEDHGKGFDAEAALRSYATSGLAGMRERAALLGGHLTVDSKPGEGTRVTAEIPLTTEVNDQPNHNPASR